MKTMGRGQESNQEDEPSNVRDWNINPTRSHKPGLTSGGKQEVKRLA